MSPPKEFREERFPNNVSWCIINPYIGKVKQNHNRMVKEIIL